MKKFAIITPIIAPQGTKGIIVHDTDDQGDPQSRNNVTNEAIYPGAIVELDPNAEWTKRWIRNGCIAEPTVEKATLKITKHTTAEGLNDDFTMSDLRAFAKQNADKFDDVPISSLKKAELIDVILERMGK